MSGRTRVLQVVNDLSMGGAPTVVLDLVEELDPTRFESWILALSEPDDLLETRPLPEGVELVTAVTTPADDYSVTGYLKHAFLRGRARKRGTDAIDRIREIDPDVLHFHTVVPDLAIGIAAARDMGAALVFTDHGMRLRGDEYSPIVRGLLRVALRTLYRPYHLVWVGRAVAEAHLAADLVGKGKLHLQLDNRVDTSRFRPAEEAPESPDPAERGRGPGAPVEIVYVARIHPAKGHDTLIRAFVSMEADLPVRLTLVGPDESGGAIGCLVDELGRLDRPVRLLGSRPDVPEILRASDIGVFPSFREGMPLALLEMMATGLPVVVSDLPELTEVVRDQVNGLTVPVGDADALARELARLVADSSLRSRLGRAARESVARAQPDRKAMGAFYQAVLEAEGGSRD